MLDGALLIGQEEDDVHPRDGFRGGGRLGEPRLERGHGEGRRAQKIATPPVHVHGDPFSGRRVIRLTEQERRQPVRPAPGSSSFDALIRGGGFDLQVGFDRGIGERTELAFINKRA
jgi:hypothetical protein